MDNREMQNGWSAHGLPLRSDCAVLVYDRWNMSALERAAIVLVDNNRRKGIPFPISEASHLKKILHATSVPFQLGKKQILP